MGENEESHVLGVKVEADSPKKNKDGCNQRTINGSDLLQESELQLIRFVQEKRFSAELKVLMSRNKDVIMPRNSTIKQLDPFLNGNGIICVGV